MRNVLLKALKSIASIEDWSGRWVHYSKTPYLKINPKPFHRDPTGIYLFPEEFVPEGHLWETFPYKFVVELPKDAKVLDLAKVSREEMTDIVKHCFGYIGRDITQEELDKLEKHKDYQDYGWEIMTNSDFMYAKSKWNKAFRDLGYDAIFDDLRAIHTSEIQLLILHPNKLKIVDMVRKSGSGFNELKKVTDDLAERFKEYGEVTVEEPKKRPEGSWTRNKVLNSTITIENGERSADIKIQPNDDLTAINIHLSRSRPRLGHGIGFDYVFKKKDYDRMDGFSKALDKIFNGPHEYEVGKE